MKRKWTRRVLSTAILSLLAIPAWAQITLEPLAVNETGIFDDSAAEIVAFDAQKKMLFVTNSAESQIDRILVSSIAGEGEDVINPKTPIDVSAYGGPTSVGAKNGLVAVAVAADPETDPGQVVFLDSNGMFVNAVEVGVLPDMLTFSPDGTKVLTANEGQPNDEYTVDPEGSVSIIDISLGAASATVQTVGFTAFNDLEQELKEAGVRIFGPNASVAQDLEPEYVAVSEDSQTAWVTLQENNAIAILDIAAGEFTEIVALGFKDHLLPVNALDPSDRDDGINIANWPVLGMYQPDAIKAFSVAGETFLITANEGDGRDYDGFSEEARIKDLTIGHPLINRYPDLQANENLGRLKTTTEPPFGKRILGNGTEVYSELYAYGARSFSIWTADGELVFDSGDDFEQLTATCPLFNSTNDDNDSCDNRSDDKGPEPEAVVVGEVEGRLYAFIGLERTGGIMIYDVSAPTAPFFVDYVTTRNFDGDPEAGTGGDLAPEGLVFISAADSPTGTPLVVVAHEVSGTTTIFEVVSN